MRLVGEKGELPGGLAVAPFLLTSGLHYVDLSALRVSSSL